MIVLQHLIACLILAAKGMLLMEVGMCSGTGLSGMDPSDPFGERSGTGLSAFGEPDSGALPSAFPLSNSCTQSAAVSCAGDVLRYCVAACRPTY